jgi:glycine cleavage system aminomethyltransferase T
MANSHADQFETLRVAAKRWELSPYGERWATPDVVYSVYANRVAPVTLGTDAGADYWNLRTGVVLYDVPERPVSIKGPDAVRLLERVFTRPVGTIRVGRGVYALACLPDGGILMDGVLFRLADNHFWYVQADGDIENWMTALGVDMDVVVSDPASRVLQIQGPRSHELLEAASGESVPEDFTWFAARFFDLGGQRLFVSNSGWTGELGIEIYGHEGLDHLRLWDHLMAVGEQFGMTMGAGDSMGPRRVEAGILDNKTDFDASMTPFAAGLGAFVNFDNPHFIGRSALETADRTKLLWGLTCDTVTPAVGDRVRFDGEDVGWMTIGERSRTLEIGIGYVRFTVHTDGGWEGKNVTLVDREGAEHPANVVVLPFFDHDKLLPRGLGEPPR